MILVLVFQQSDRQVTPSFTTVAHSTLGVRDCGRKLREQKRQVCVRPKPQPSAFR